MPKYIVFGVGYQCEKMIEEGFINVNNVVAFIDNNQKKWGMYYGKMVMSPEEGLRLDYNRIIITTLEYDDIKSQLKKKFKIPEEKIILRKDVINRLYIKLAEEKMLFLLHGRPTNSVPEGILSEGEKADDDNLVERIIEAYHRTLKYSEKSGESWWTTGELWECKKDIHKKLLVREKEEVKTVLRNPATNNLFWGFEGIAARAFVTQDDINRITRLVYDNIIQLAAYLGVTRMPNPEAMFSPKVNIDDIFDRISEMCGVDLKFPNPYPLEIGIATKRGIVGYRTVHALYQAYKIYQKMKKKQISGKVLEIGAGLGRTAYFAYQMGIKDYTILDIPMTNVAQAYFLGRTIGQENVSLVGEKLDKKIKILPAYMLEEMENERYNIILNVDSMTEMDEDSQKKYWEYIQKHTEIFLSINHEANLHTVQELYSNTNFEVQRQICPMRRGYIEEEIFF